MRHCGSCYSFLLAYLKVPVDDGEGVEVLEGGDDLDGVEVRRVDAEPAGRPEVAEELAPGHEGKHHVEEVLVLVKPLQLDEEGMLQREIVISSLIPNHGHSYLWGIRHYGQEHLRQNMGTWAQSLS